MILSDINIDYWYNAYLDQFRRSENYVRRMGGVTRGFKPLSREYFKTDFLTEVSSLKNAGKIGGKAIAQAMAKQEVYPLTYKQAVATSKAHARKYGGNPYDYVNYYRTGAEQTIFDDIRRRRRELKNENLSNHDIEVKIGEEFYGSE